MRALKSIFLTLMLISTCAIAGAINKVTLPTELMYQGKPIDPLCFYEDNDKKSVLLTKCGLHKESGRKFKSHNPYLINKGFTGYEFTWQVDPDTPPSLGFSYYKVLGRVTGGYLLFTLNNGGGTGIFSSIALVKRQGDAVNINLLFTGDRCNNGIIDANLKNEILTYSVNLSPFDFLEVTHDNPHKLKAYDDLDACATCCIAAATLKQNLQSKQEKLLFVELKPPYELGGDPESGKYQKCFNKLINQYRHAHKVKLDDAALKTFVDKFNAECIPK